MDELNRLLLLEGKNACRSLPKGKITNLSDVEFRVSSQFGEDGIIEWLVSHIPCENDKFVEFGVENFHEANCRFLLQNRNWKGFVIDGSAHYIDELRNRDYYWMHYLASKSEFVTRENINDLIVSAGFGGSLGILSIDLDGNDYWVWEAIDCCSPEIVICEFNGIFGDKYPIVVPYRSDFARFAAHFSGEYFGASLPALVHLAKRKGYRFVGTTSTGVNAFFVKNSAFPAIRRYLATAEAFPYKLRMSRGHQGELIYHENIREIFDLFSDLPVVNVATGKEIELGSLRYPYSDKWLRYLD